MNGPLPSDDRERLEALHRFAVLDTPPESAFDDLTALAAQICGTPIAVIALVDADRQWFKSRIGWSAEEAPRTGPLCAHSLGLTDLHIVPDAAQDPRFSNDPLVVGEPHLRFYAAAPLRTLDGHCLGALCVIDRVPRQLSREQQQALRALSRQVLSQLQFRQETRELGRSQAALLGILEDQTRSEGALRLNEERFRRLAEASSDCIWDWDLQTGEMSWSESFTTVFGYRRNEIEPRISWWKDRLHPDDRSRVVAKIQQAIESGGGKWTDEYRFLLRDGSTAFVADCGSVLRDAAGRALRVVVGQTDLTERKHLEQELLRAQRMDGISTLAGGIAHSMNNVLGPIMMSIDLLKMRFIDDPTRGLLATIDASAHHGAGLLRQVLAFARGVEGERVEVPIRSVIRDVEDFVNQTYLNNVRIRTHIPPDLWVVVGDRGQLQQVLLNLCANARDAMPRGGTLTISAENRTLDARQTGVNLDAHPGPYVLIRVEDTGTGMPAEIMDMIFDPFFTTKEIGRGSGLGLSNALGIVKSHGGFLRVASELGKGTIFSIYLPAKTVSTPAVTTTVQGELLRGQGKLILVVDDEAAVRNVTQQTLEVFGYRVVLACDGAEAVAIYGRQKDEIAAVLTDMMMPVMDGAAAIQALRSMNPKLPIIAASGLSTSDPTARAASLDVNAFLPKPFTAATLLRALHDALAK